MPTYNKLVRDRIPEILEEKGKAFVARPATSEEEYVTKLKEKLQEEVDEFLENPCAEEMADIQEVLDALSHHIGTTALSVLNIKEEKATARGCFYNGIILESVED